MMRRILAATLATFTISMGGGSASAEVIERVAAVVNDEIVLLSELNERIGPMLRQLRQIGNAEARMRKLQELREQALEQVIGEKLIVQQARRLRISVSERDLDLAMQDVMQKNNLGKEEFEVALRREGKSIEAYKQQLLKPQLLRLRVLQVQVRPRVSVTEDELRALYQKNLRELGAEAQVKARHIFISIPVDATPEVVADRKAKALELLNQLSEGAVFSELARKHSQDSLTAKEGGDLGYFTEGTLPMNIEKVVFAMKSGETTGPLRSDRGFHIIKVEDKKDAAALPLRDVRTQLQQQLFQEKMQRATKSWLAELRKKAYVDVKI